jgi:hypothetical protein
MNINFLPLLSTNERGELNHHEQAICFLKANFSQDLKLVLVFGEIPESSYRISASCRVLKCPPDNISPTLWIYPEVLVPPRHYDCHGHQKIVILQLPFDSSSEDAKASKNIKKILESALSVSDLLITSCSARVRDLGSEDMVSQLSFIHSALEQIHPVPSNLPIPLAVCVPKLQYASEKSNYSNPSSQEAEDEEAQRRSKGIITNEFQIGQLLQLPCELLVLLQLRSNVNVVGIPFLLDQAGNRKQRQQTKQTVITANTAESSNKLNSNKQHGFPLQPFIPGLQDLQAGNIIQAALQQVLQTSSSSTKAVSSAHGPDTFSVGSGSTVARTSSSEAKLPPHLMLRACISKLKHGKQGKTAAASLVYWEVRAAAEALFLEECADTCLHLFQRQ